MLDRRSVLKSGAAAAALTLGTPALARAAAAATNSEGAKLNKLFDAFMDEIIDQAPEFATSLGIDKGDRAYQRSMVSDRSLAQVEFFKRMNTDQLGRLKAIDRGALGASDVTNYDVILYGFQ